MFSNKSFAYIIKLLIINCFTLTNAKIKSKVPPDLSLYTFDDYQQCMMSATDQSSSSRSSSSYSVRNDDFSNVYCMIYAEIDAKPESLLWHQIINHSTLERFNYRYDHLFYGVCMKRCLHFLQLPLQNSSTKQQQQQHHTHQLQNEITSYFEYVHRRPLDVRIRSEHHQLFADCLNNEFQQKHNLTLKTFVEYCDRPRVNAEKDLAYFISIFLIVGITGLNVLSSRYDMHLRGNNKLKLNNDKDSYYKLGHTNQANKILTAFSVKRNFYRLTLPSSGQLGKDFEFLNLYRFLLSIFIISEHTSFVQYGPLSNPQDMENLYRTSLINIYLHSTVLIKLFFVISGLMLYIKFERARYITTKSSFAEMLKTFFNLLLSRYLRFLPSLVLLISVTAGIYAYVDDGPFLRHFIEPCRVNCRENWWKNLLMLNNFNLNTSCWGHMWYIAADIHLYGLFLIVLIIMAKYPKLKSFLIISIGFLGILLPVGISYYLKLDSIPTLMPESFRYSHFVNAYTMFKIYFPSYCYIDGYWMGMLCGLIYMNYLMKDEKFKMNLGNYLKIATYLGWPLVVVIFYFGEYFLFKQHTLWTDFYGILHRNVSIAIIVIITIVHMMCRGGYFDNSAVIRCLGRSSFQTYLWHLPMFLLPFSVIHHTISFSIPLWGIIFIYLVLAGNTLAFVVALLLEYPVAEILNMLELKKPSSNAKLM